MGQRRTHRGRLQILADILRAAEKSPLKTHIMFQSQLNYGVLSRYLNDLVGAGLLRVVDGSSYFLTQKGRMFLDKFMEYSERRRQLAEKFEHVSNEKAMLESVLSNSGAK